MFCALVWSSLSAIVSYVYTLIIHPLYHKVNLRNRFFHICVIYAGRYINVMSNNLLWLYRDVRLNACKKGIPDPSHLLDLGDVAKRPMCRAPSHNALG